ncbi:unnamed protein product [Gemmataceae bacterium]|nr:unnamed protein product [Gemmataceae bacterium]VTU00257.1 unnamed protein product [Gemmataceae bacterium]
MRRAILLVLPAVSLLCGCHALARDSEVIAYRPGEAVTTTVAKEDATYRLSARDGRQGWIGTEVSRGGAVGFRQEADGQVTAFAGSQTWPIEASDGRHVWLSTPKPTSGWDRFIVRTRDKSASAFQATVLVITAPIWLTWCAVTNEWP